MSDTDYPFFPDSEAARLVGKTIIVGVTHQDPAHNILRQEQYFGTIIRTSAQEGIVVLLSGSDVVKKFPPDLRAVRAAPPGEYQFRTTGEIVCNPELIPART